MKRINDNRLPLDINNEEIGYIVAIVDAVTIIGEVWIDIKDRL